MHETHRHGLVAFLSSGNRIRYISLCEYKLANRKIEKSTQQTGGRRMVKKRDEKLVTSDRRVVPYSRGKQISH